MVKYTLSSYSNVVVQHAHDTECQPFLGLDVWVKKKNNLKSSKHARNIKGSKSQNKVCIKCDMLWTVIGDWHYEKSFWGMCAE